MLSFKSKAPHFKMHFFSPSIVLKYVVFKLQYVFVHLVIIIGQYFIQKERTKQTCDPYLLACYYSHRHPSCRAIRRTLCSERCFSAAWWEWRTDVSSSAPWESVEVLRRFAGWGLQQAKTSLHWGYIWQRWCSSSSASYWQQRGKWMSCWTVNW